MQYQMTVTLEWQQCPLCPDCWGLHLIDPDDNYDIATVWKEWDGYFRNSTSPRDFSKPERKFRTAESAKRGVEKDLKVRPMKESQ